MAASPLIPELQTDRLTLRGHSLADFQDCAAMWREPAVVRFIGGKPATVEEVWTRVLRYVGHWSLLDFGYWVVQEKTSGRFVGEVGFADFKRDIQPSLTGMPEAGWVLAPWAHGKGYATEALRGALAWGTTHFGGARTVCLIDPSNLPSIRVAQKCGYQEQELTAYKGQPTLLFAR